MSNSSSRFVPKPNLIGPSQHNVHSEVPPFACWVTSKVFFDGILPEKEDPIKRCVVFGISSYQGQEPTFSVRVSENGAVFHNIPIRYIRSKRTIPVEHLLFENQLVYHNCPDYNIVVNTYSYLQGTVHAFVHSPVATSPYQVGEYFFTVDWFKDNRNLHLIGLEGGQYVLLPSHKVLFRPPPGMETLPNYKKMHGVWTVSTKPLRTKEVPSESRTGTPSTEKPEVCVLSDSRG